MQTGKTSTERRVGGERNLHSAAVIRRETRYSLINMFERRKEGQMLETSLGSGGVVWVVREDEDGTCRDG